MNTFITLPSGVRINTAHLVLARRSEHEGQILLGLTDETTPWLETMTLEELDALLQPQQSPIVSPVRELKRFTKGDPVRFWVDGVEKHGIVDRVFTDPPQAVWAVSDGVKYSFDPWDGSTVRLPISVQ